jgi:hypothetical protein
MEDVKQIPKYTIYTEPDTPEESFMAVWIDKWHDKFYCFENTGCGCCINIYEFDVEIEAINELPSDLIRVDLYAELHRPIRTGRPSSFGEFINHFKT